MSANAQRVQKIWLLVSRPACALADSPNSVLFMLAAAQLFQLSSTWIPTRDGAAYLSIARNISSGEGLVRFGEPHLHFAPGYPILIAPAFFLRFNRFF